MTNLRRTYLSVTLKLLLLTALMVVVLMLISSLRQADTEHGKAANPWRVEVDLSALQPGDIKQVNWPGGEVWIYRRTPADLQQFQQASTDRYRDPASRLSEQPDAAVNAHRSLAEDYFVFLPFETVRHCQVQITEFENGQRGFRDPCYNAQFDMAGRILKNTGNLEQRNLSVPPHHYLTTSRIEMSGW